MNAKTVVNFFVFNASFRQAQSLQNTPYDSLKSYSLRPYRITHIDEFIEEYIK